jgi:hypothetical protein
MNRAIERRIVKLERRLARPSDDVTVFIITGGVCSEGGTTAGAGGSNWTQGPDETFAAFKARVLAEATSAGQHHIIIGGLPELSAGL